MKNARDRKRRWNWQGYLWTVCLMTVLCLGLSTRVEAATTCKSKISYPGVTTSQVNMRKKAGIKYKSYGMVESGTELTILGYVNNGGQTWYKCKGSVNGAVKTGYISASYVTKAYRPTGVVNNKVSSTLNVRKSAKTSAKRLVKLPRGTEVTILSIKKVSGKYWYKIRTTYNNKTKTGYVLSTYIDVNRTLAQDTTIPPTTEAPAATTQTPTTQAPQMPVTPAPQTPVTPAPETPTPPVVGPGTPGTEHVLQGFVNEQVTSVLNVRNTASTQSPVLMTIPSGTSVTILSTTGDWYQITVTYNGRTVTGYVYKTYITIRVQTETPTVVDDGTYETLLAAFPDSYKNILNNLHATHPNWRFVAVNTGLDWNAVIENESRVGVNVIQSNYPRGTSSLAPFSYLSTAPGAYDWSSDRYVVKDGVNWYCANPSVIAYYMDPRNFLNETDIFQFEALAYDQSHNSTVVQAILNNTFMQGSYSVVDSATNQTVTGTYTQAFMDAGVISASNPYFLASRCKQEVGVNGSNSTSGTYSGYEGIYNFYNIGAFDGTNAVARGLQWAKGGASGDTTYNRPWTTPYKSIVGGAQYIASQYIQRGQNTLYFQKFNVKPANPAHLYTHQYMTNVQAPYNEGRSTRNAYYAQGVIDNVMVFYIPVYNNMPAGACPLPAVAGNPNPFLNSITVKNGNTVIPGMATITLPDANGNLSNSTYSVVVGRDVASVTVNAAAISRYTTVTGTGTVSLGNPGTTTTVQVTGIAQNGTSQIYTVNITRNAQ